MTDATALERAAKAAWRLTCLGLKETEVEAVWNNQDTKEKLMFVALARAVLMAVRDLPDEFVMSAEYLVLDDQDSFAACIDAILADGEGR